MTKEKIDEYLKNIKSAESIDDKIILDVGKALVDGSFLDENGILKDFREYDQLLYEYLKFFYKRGEAVPKEAKVALKIMMDAFLPGSLSSSKTYSEFLIKSQFFDIGDFSKAIVIELLAKIYEFNGKDERCTKEEFELFYNTFVSEEYGLLKNILGNLRDITPEDIKIIQYVIRLQKKFENGNRPSNEYLGKIYDWSRNVDIIGELKKSIPLERLKECDKSELEVVDVALALIFEADFKEGEKILSISFFEECRIAFERVGLDFLNSNTMAKITELYVGVPANRKSFGSDIYIFMESYIISKASNPSVEWLMEQGLSDLMQLVFYENDSAFGMDNYGNLRSAFDEGIERSGVESDIGDYNSVIDDFILEFSDKAILPEHEKKFEMFLQCLSLCRYKNRGLLTQSQVDFILSQSLRSDSILNLCREKYNFVVERALEDFGKLRIFAKHPGEKVGQLYLIRDYIENYSTMGFNTKFFIFWTGMQKVIRIKSVLIDMFLMGDCTVIKTVCHENYHTEQDRTFKSVPKSFRELEMIKEDFIMEVDPDYERRNYVRLYREVEAEEKGAEDAAEYMYSLVPKEYRDKSVDELDDTSNGLLARRLLSERERFIKHAQEVRQLYNEAHLKRDCNNSKKTVSQIFDEYLRICMKKGKPLEFSDYPGLLLEYNEDGSKKTFGELLNLAASGKYDYTMMRDIIRYGGSINSIDGLDLLRILNRHMMLARTPESINFINDVIADNFARHFALYVLGIMKNSESDIEDTDKFELLFIYRILKLIQSKKDDETFIFAEGFKRSVGEHSAMDYIDRLILKMERQNPDLSNDKIHKFYTSGLGLILFFMTEATTEKQRMFVKKMIVDNLGEYLENYFDSLSVDEVSKATIESDIVYIYCCIKAIEEKMSEPSFELLSELQDDGKTLSIKLKALIEKIESINPNMKHMAVKRWEQEIFGEGNQTVSLEKTVVDDIKFSNRDEGDIGVGSREDKVFNGSYENVADMIKDIPVIDKIKVGQVGAIGKHTIKIFE